MSAALVACRISNPVGCGRDAAGAASDDSALAAWLDALAEP
jgi:hypothetical protein